MRMQNHLYENIRGLMLLDSRLNNYSDQDSVILAQRQIGQWKRIESGNRSTYKLSSSFRQRFQSNLVEKG